MAEKKKSTKKKIQSKSKAVRSVKRGVAKDKRFAAPEKSAKHTAEPTEKKSQVKHKEFKITPIIVIGAVVVIAVLAFAFSGMSDNGSDDTGYIGESVKMELYVMSQCPYGVQAENIVLPLKEVFGDALDIQIEFIVSENPDGTFKSLHGQPEIDENILQLCALEHDPDDAFDFILCRNNNIRDTDWSKCAENNSIDTVAMDTCIDGEEGAELIRKSINASENAGASASPTILIDGTRYVGQRDGTAFTRAICLIIPDHSECANISKPVEIQFTVINDERCEELSCDTTQVTDVTKQLFPGVIIKEIDYSTEEGKKLYETLELQYIPAYIFDSAVEEGASFEQIQNALIQKGDSWIIVPQATGSVFDPTKEICDNGIDDTGNDLVDCEDPDCAGEMDCREEKKATVNLFVMSQCPYGVMAVDNMEEVLDTFGDDLSFTINYIANDNGDGTFTSLHGQPEVDENIRQVCAAEKYPDKYFDYVLCINNNYRNAGSIWENCTSDAGIDKDVITDCVSEEGPALLSENIKLAGELKIGSSPTFMINNRYIFRGAQPAAQIQQNICENNPELAGCSDTIEGSNQQAPAGSC